MEEFLRPLIPYSLFAFVAGLIVTRLAISFGHRLGLVAKPNRRRRHGRKVPYVGGLSVITAWCLGVGAYAWFNPEWLSRNSQSAIVIMGGVVLMMAVGFWDDLFELEAGPKLILQSAAALLVIAFEPRVHALLQHWELRAGIAIWIFAFVWILAITNSINLIDGLDGLAGGMSILSGLSILTLSVWIGAYADFSIVTLAILLPAIAAFLLFNWYPARAFLGDNGSLPIGFFLASTTLMNYSVSKSWVMILSMVLIFGYPLLDMGICVYRRYRTRQALFKADRGHLHFRICRLGLPTPRTALVLLSVGVYLQVSSLAVNKMSPASAALGLALVTFSLFTLLAIVASFEHWKARRAFRAFGARSRARELGHEETAWVLSIDLRPILEGDHPSAWMGRLVECLEALLQTMIRDGDRVVTGDLGINVIFTGMDEDPEIQRGVQERFRAQLDEFLRLYNIESTTAGLPMELARKRMVHWAETPAVQPVPMATRGSVR